MSDNAPMHQITVNVEVHFHEQEVVSIFHETNATGSEEQFAELVFAGAFAIRSMSNLGVNSTTDSLAECLHLMAQLIVDAPNEMLAAKPTIVRYPGTPGRKQFISNLRLSKHQMQLRYSPKGFGWLATGVGYYCPVAVQSIFRYFASRRSDHRSYLAALANTAIGCGQLQRARQIQLTNHPQLVMTLICTCMEGFVPEWLVGE